MNNCFQDLEENRAELIRKERELASKRQGLQAEKQKVAAEKEKVEKLRGQKLEVPPYWQKSAAEAAKDNFALHPIRQGDAEWVPLAECLQTPNSTELGRGRDVHEAGQYSRLELVRAWRVESATKWRNYRTKQQVISVHVTHARTSLLLFLSCALLSP